MAKISKGADNIRILAASMVEAANSGHPGGAMGAAEFMNVLYSRFLVYDPEDPCWMGRDRFFLDPGHMSALLYSTLALTGKYTMEELRRFRQWGSVTPGHPELDVERGVENTSGPLGQGHVMAVGCAIAESILEARFGKIVAHKTYALISDGGVQEEISQGAGRIAGALGLHNLIMYYDSNNVQLSTKVDEVTTEDTGAKYRAWGWNVMEVNGSDEQEIADALLKANKEKERPTLIIGHTTMARKVVKADGSSLEGAVSTHGQPLSKAGADIRKTIEAMGGDPEKPWRILPEVEEEYAERRIELKQIVEARKKEYVEWALHNMELRDELALYYNKELPELNWDELEFKESLATRAASAQVLGFLAQHVPNMVVSSADLANSDKTDGFLKKTRALSREDMGGAFLQAGVAELTMAALMNGIALHGGFIPACGTFFVFSDYEKPAIRMSALMELPVKYIFTHDSFRVGEDGPTHEPIEQEAQIRLLEQVRNFSGKRSAIVLRPADGLETMACYEVAMNTWDRPSVMIFSREDIPSVSMTQLGRKEVVEGVKKGGYAIYDGSEEGKLPDVVLLGSGSDVSLLYEAAMKLKEDRITSKVVSIPSLGMLMDQGEDYLKELMPEGVPQFALSSGLPSVFYPILDGKFMSVGMERFGASAPAKVLNHQFGYETEKIYDKIKHFLRK